MLDPDDAHLSAWLAGIAAAARRELAARPVAMRTLRYGPAAAQAADLWLPDSPGPHPVAVSLHGGYFRDQYQRDLHDPLAADLVRHGAAVLNVEYRRIGSGGGPVNSVADVMAAITALGEEPGVHADRLVVFGHSAGGYLALRAAEHPAVHHVVALAAVSDLRDAVDRGVDHGAIVRWFREEGDSTDFAAAELTARAPGEARYTLIHGAHDATVPCAQSVRYAEWARVQGAATRLDLLPDDGHFAFLDPGQSAWHTARAAILNAT